MDEDSFDFDCSDIVAGVVQAGEHAEEAGAHGIVERAAEFASFAQERRAQTFDADGELSLDYSESVANVVAREHAEKAVVEQAREAAPQSCAASARSSPS